MKREGEAMKRRVDPLDPANHGAPLWMVYGSRYFPSVMCVKLSTASLVCDGPEGPPIPTVWGFSMWQGRAGFRTLGLLLDAPKFGSRGHYANPRFYRTFKDAMRRVRKCGPEEET